MLEAIGLTKEINGSLILDNINLSIGFREVVSIVGSSGAGKTTLLQLLGTLDKPTKGTIKIANQEPLRMSANQLAHFRNTEIGFVFQFHQLLPEFNALENVMMPALIGGLSQKEAQEKASHLLEKMGLSDRMNHFPSTLSGGEQQRVAVARSIVNKPKVLFADEPTGNLDAQFAHSLHELFFQLRDDFDLTIVIVTHNSELANMADRVLTMDKGKLQTA